MFQQESQDCERSADRVQYSKIVDGVRKFVIAEFRNGIEAFWEQESGEPRWFRFDPAPQERRAAKLLFAEGGQQQGWPRLEVVDVFWIVNLLDRYRWSTEDLALLHRTVFSIGFDPRSAMDGREFMPDGEQQRLADYLVLSIALRECHPELGSWLTLVQDHLNELLDRRVPEHRRNKLQQIVACAVRQVLESCQVPQRTSAAVG